jgi:hypothetical protein
MVSVSGEGMVLINTSSKVLMSGYQTTRTTIIGSFHLSARCARMEDARTLANNCSIPSVINDQLCQLLTGQTRLTQYRGKKARQRARSRICTFRDLLSFFDERRTILLTLERLDQKKKRWEGEKALFHTRR